MAQAESGNDSVRSPIRHERCSGAATPLDPETKSSSIPHSRAPARLRPKDRNDNCSTATLADQASMHYRSFSPRFFVVHMLKP